MDGSDASCNESGLTSESDDKVKSIKPVSAGGDVFLLSGSSTFTGYAHMLVTAVGEQRRWGKTEAKLVAETVEKLDVFASQIGNMGILAAVATFIAMMALWCIYPENREADVNVYEYC